MFGKNQEEKIAPDFEYFVIYDSKVGVYREPMLSINRHDLLREFERLFRDPAQKNNQLVTNSEDFSIFKIGEYSKKTGVFLPQKHEHIANLHEVRSAVMRSIPVRDDAPQQMRDVNSQPQLGII